MSPSWLQLLGPNAAARAIVKRTGVLVDDALLELEVGNVVLGPHPHGLAEEESRACVGYAREHMPARWRAEVAGGGGRLAVGRSALKKAFSRHVEASQITSLEAHDASSLLLGVYAVECGLKSLLLQKQRVDSTLDLDEQYFTHDLNVLYVAVAGKKPFPENLLLERDGQIGLARLHEALRYGERLRKDAFDSALRATKEAVSYVKENLS